MVGLWSLRAEAEVGVSPLWFGTLKLINHRHAAAIVAIELFQLVYDFLVSF